MDGQCYCNKCNKTLNEKEFYHLKDGTAFDLCKKCTVMHINPFQEDTFLWLLEKFDVPYIPREWATLRDKDYAKNPKKLTAVFGKYLSKMKLVQWKEYSWKDTEEFVEKEKQEQEEYLKEHPEQALKSDQLRQQYDAGLISEAEYKTRMSAEIQHESRDDQAARIIMGDDPFAVQSASPQLMQEFVNPAVDLTNDDKMMLAMKWGTMYRPQEWISLEKTYTEMTNSFDIQDADTINTLKMICKCILKMDQAIDIGDIDSFNKLSRTYESLRKSAKFTAAQNKEQKDEFVDCVGRMVDYCEKVGGVIPSYDLSFDYDILDKIIKDLKEYNRTLVYSDTALANQIENYIKNRENADQHKRDKEEAAAMGLEAPVISDDDVIDYQNSIIEGAEDDKAVYKEGGE